MLNYRNSLAVFILILISLLIFSRFSRIDPVVFLVMVSGMLILLILGSIRIRMNFYLRSFCKGDKKSQAVALSFDDGPDQAITPRLLDILEKEKIRVVFFLIGSKAAENKDLVSRIVREGHLIGNHSYSHHFFFDLFPSRRMRDELKETASEIYLSTGVSMRWFRPPYGVTNPVLAKVVQHLGYTSIGWSLKSKDTVIRDKNELLARLKRKVKPGDLILFHDNRPILLTVLPEFIRYLRNQHLNIVRPDKLFNIPAYEEK
jgi:peptidoglycan/xylan/chitin deacetylase (PgdA/CDA1 family)